MDLELAGKVALVTGSSRGIGLAIAERLALEGARVVMNGRASGPLTLAATRLGMPSMIGDMTDAGQCAALAKRIEREHGRLDILVCNVGSGRANPPGSETPEDWQRMLALNLAATTQTVGAMTELLARSSGSIVCISSICGVEALGCPVPYAAAKAALNAYVRTSARPLARRRVRINAVAPGNILFPGSVWEQKLAADAAQVRAMLDREVALARLGTAAEIADWVAFLSSARASFATGQIFVVDGGQVRS